MEATEDVEGVAEFSPRVRVNLCILSEYGGEVMEIRVTQDQHAPDRGQGPLVLTAMMVVAGVKGGQAWSRGPGRHG